MVTHMDFFSLARVCRSDIFFRKLFSFVHVVMQDVVLHLPRCISLKDQLTVGTCCRWRKRRKSKAGSFIAFQTFPCFNIIY